VTQKGIGILAPSPRYTKFCPDPADLTISQKYQFNAVVTSSNTVKSLLRLTKRTIPDQGVETRWELNLLV
jgi:hypothetical protein